MTKRSRSAAAKKGWATRRKRDAAKRAERERRSAAAKRGWDVRRRREAMERVRRKRETIVTPPTPPKPPTFVSPFEVPPFEDEADMAVEWEIGFEYRGGDSNSYVDVNIRISRDDGRRMGFEEARAVFAAMRDQLSPNADPIPPGYTLSYIDWTRPRWHGTTRGGHDGGVYDLLQFSNPMYVEKDNDTAWTLPQPRFGSVKS